MNLRKLAVAGVCIGAMTIGLCGCGKADSTTQTTTPETKETKTSYTIGISKDADNEYHDGILQGFIDGISDYFPDGNVTITNTNIDEANTSEGIAGGYVTNNTSLIYAIGSNALTGAAGATADIPIVASGIMDYKTLLNIQTEEGKEWDGTTDRNITGTSSIPYISDVLSMLIEVTPTPDTIGLIYNQEDSDSIYQNNQLKTYLDQAGIKWKEYPLTSADLNKRSIKAIIDTACSECSALFIPAESSLRNNMETIMNVAEDHNIPTVGGDEYIGEYTLVSMYQDPYEQGYEAAYKAYKILDGGDNIKKMSIKNYGSGSGQKLYVKDIADSMGLTFPKSFKERNEFLASYKLGSNTKRVEKETK